MIKKLILLTSLILTLTVLSPNSTYALSCAEYEESVIDYYDLAIIGKVTDIYKRTNDYMYPVEVEVVKSWKQQVPSTLQMEVDYTWGHEFQKGQTYLIYLSVDDDQFINSPCSPVTQVDSEDDFKDPSLGEEFAPAVVENQEVEPGNFMTYYFPVFLLFSLSAAILISLLIKKKN